MNASVREKSYRIVALTAENVKRLTAVHIEPKGNVVQITGKNRNGKTSVLDSIWWCIEGASHIQATPIRRGAKNARIRLDLGELIVTRTFGAKEDGGYTTSITVESPDGAVFKSPQKLLDDLVGELSFDPLAFARMKPKDQFDALQKFVEGVDIAKLDALNAGDKARRTDINRDLKAASAILDGVVVTPEPPAERIDEAELTAALQAAGDQNTDTELRRTNRESMAAQAEDMRQQAAAARAAIPAKLEARKSEHERLVADLEAQIAALRLRITNADEQYVADTQAIETTQNAAAEDLLKRAEEIDAKLAAAKPLAPIIDTVALAAQLNAARESNRLLDQWEAAVKRRNELQKTVDALAQQSDELTARMTERTQAKNDAIAKAHMPVDGLGFGDGFITLRGVPFEQGSDAEQLEASVAIAAALNPKLRVIRIRDGSLLDSDAMARLEQIAEERDFQVWIERVDGSGTVGFVLEDGHLKRAENTEATAA